MGKTLRALGLMSGTSMDGIDVALIETDGEEAVQRGPTATFPYSGEFRATLVTAIEDAKAVRRREDRPGILRAAERRLTDLHAEAVEQFLAGRGLEAGVIDVIGFHGQTVLHHAGTRSVTSSPSGSALTMTPTLTVQIGDGEALARRCRIDVVYDLRAADVAAGGQGAPLAPVYHRALAARLRDRPVAVVNVGGVANVTWISKGGTLLAFDTGPGNALIDDWMLHHTGRAMDPEGSAAAGGEVHDDALTKLFINDYFGQLPPKSLDRNAFGMDAVRGLSVADGAATLTAFTAAAIGRAREHFPEEPGLWVICGGGRRNKTLMVTIAARVECAVVPAEAVGFDGDAVEAEAWAYLAVRSLRGLPVTFPGTTGVPAPTRGGVLARAGG